MGERRKSTMVGSFVVAMWTNLVRREPSEFAKCCGGTGSGNSPAIHVIVGMWSVVVSHMLPDPHVKVATWSL